MSAIELRLRDEPLTQVPADVGIAGFFADDRPLRGAAGHADWRLCGLLSDLIASRNVSGAPGEAVLLPSQGRIRPRRMLLLGLGERLAFRESFFGAATKIAFERSVRLGAERIVMEPLGIARDELADHAELFLTGLVQGLAGSTAPVQLSLCTDASGRASRALREAAAHLELPLHVSTASHGARRDAALPLGPPTI